MIRVLKIGAVGGMFLALLGCGSPDNHYYTLSAAAPAPPPLGQTGRNVAIEDLSIPGALDRPQIVVGLDDNRVDVREFDRWAEPFDGLVRRILSDDLRARLRDRLLEKPDKDSLLLSVTIDAFGREGDRVVLRGRWVLKDQRKDAVASPPHGFDEVAPLVQNDQLPATVAGMSRLLGNLSDGIAAALDRR